MKYYGYEEDTNGEDSEGNSCKEPSGNKPRFDFAKSYAVSLNTDASDEAGLKTNIDRIKKEIYTNGIVMTAMTVFESFMNITSANNTPSTPYNTQVDKGQSVGGHAVVIVGWGTIPGKDASDYTNQYSIMRNFGDRRGVRIGLLVHSMGDGFNDKDQEQYL